MLKSNIGIKAAALLLTFTVGGATVHAMVNDKSEKASGSRAAYASADRVLTDDETADRIVTDEETTSEESKVTTAVTYTTTAVTTTAPQTTTTTVTTTAAPETTTTTTATTTTAAPVEEVPQETVIYYYYYEEPVEEPVYEETYEQWESDDDSQYEEETSQNDSAADTEADTSEAESEADESQAEEQRDDTSTADEKNPNAITVTDEEYMMLCNLVGHEYGADWVDEYEKALVVEVVMNRVNSPLFPNTIYDVLVQPGQFVGSYAYMNGYTYQVTDSVRRAVDLYLSDPTQFDHGYLSFWGDGYRNHFS